MTSSSRKHTMNNNTEPQSIDAVISDLMSRGSEQNGPNIQQAGGQLGHYYGPSVPFSSTTSNTSSLPQNDFILAIDNSANIEASQHSIPAGDIFMENEVRYGQTSQNVHEAQRRNHERIRAKAGSYS